MHLSLDHTQAASLNRLLNTYFERSDTSKGNIKYSQDGSTIKWEDDKSDFSIELDIPDKKQT